MRTRAVTWVASAEVLVKSVWIASRRALAGNSVQRIDIPDKVLGRPRFIHDQALAGMLHGRVLRPENARAKLADLKEDGARATPGLIAIERDERCLPALRDIAEAFPEAIRHAEVRIPVEAACLRGGEPELAAPGVLGELGGADAGDGGPSPQAHARPSASATVTVPVTWVVRIWAPVQALA